MTKENNFNNEQEAKKWHQLEFDFNSTEGEIKVLRCICENSQYNSKNNFNSILDICINNYLNIHEINCDKIMSKKDDSSAKILILSEYTLKEKYRFLKEWALQCKSF